MWTGHSVTVQITDTKEKSVADVIQRGRRVEIADTRQQCYPATMERAERLKRRATNEDLLDVPDHLVAEIVDGELFTTPRPALRHAHASSTLGGELFAPFHLGRGGPGGWLQPHC